MHHVVFLSLDSCYMQVNIMLSSSVQTAHAGRICKLLSSSVQTAVTCRSHMHHVVFLSLDSCYMQVAMHHVVFLSLDSCYMQVDMHHVVFLSLDSCYMQVDMHHVVFLSLDSCYMQVIVVLLDSCYMQVAYASCCLPQSRQLLHAGRICIMLSSSVQTAVTCRSHLMLSVQTAVTCRSHMHHVVFLSLDSCYSRSHMHHVVFLSLDSCYMQVAYASCCLPQSRQLLHAGHICIMLSSSVQTAVTCRSHMHHVVFLSLDSCYMQVAYASCCLPQSRQLLHAGRICIMLSSSVQTAVTCRSHMHHVVFLSLDSCYMQVAYASCCLPQSRQLLHAGRICIMLSSSVQTAVTCRSHMHHVVFLSLDSCYMQVAYASCCLPQSRQLLHAGHICIMLSSSVQTAVTCRSHMHHVVFLSLDSCYMQVAYASCCLPQSRQLLHAGRICIMLSSSVQTAVTCRSHMHHVVFLSLDSCYMQVAYASCCLPQSRQLLHAGRICIMLSSSSVQTAVTCRSHMHHVVFLSLDSCYMQVTYASCCLPQSRQLLHAGRICIMLSSSVQTAVTCRSHMHHVVFLSLDSCYMQVAYASCCLPQSRQLLHAGHICIMLSSSVQTAVTCRSHMHHVVFLSLDSCYMQVAYASCCLPQSRQLLHAGRICIMLSSSVQTAVTCRSHMHHVVFLSLDSCYMQVAYASCCLPQSRQLLHAGRICIMLSSSVQTAVTCRSYMHHVVFLSLDSCYMQVTYASCCLPQSRQLLHAGRICIMLSSSVQTAVTCRSHMHHVVFLSLDSCYMQVAYASCCLPQSRQLLHAGRICIMLSSSVQTAVTCRSHMHHVVFLSLDSCYMQVAYASCCLPQSRQLLHAGHICIMLSSSVQTAVTCRSHMHHVVFLSLQICSKVRN